MAENPVFDTWDEPPLPASTRCAICNDLVDVTKKTGWCREETGWAEVRSKGGTHSLRQRQPTGRLAHLSCVIHGPMDQLL